MKKKFVFLLVSLLTISLLILNSGAAYAMDMTNSNNKQGSKDQTNFVSKMTSEYQSLHDTSKSGNGDNRFTNDMLEKQIESQKKIDTIINNARKSGKKLYSFDEIVNSNAETFGISKTDFEKIKQSILATQAEDKSTISAFETAGQGNHPIVQNIKKNEQLEIPASLIFVDHSLDKQDGNISGGGWPYCLDNNGWGNGNFITSDCYKAIVSFLICASDSTLGHMSSNLRYCKAYVRNCSPLIGHNIHWHTHPWYEQIP